VSRGGYKLEAAFEQFAINCTDKVCLDLGASTGGFTDCLLQHGAKRIYAVDVGENQISWKLRSDPRVRVLDKTNARYLKPDALDEKVDFVTADVSFISVCKVLPAAFDCARSGADFVILVKPQFEAGRELVERGGVVRNPEVHAQVIETVKKFVEEVLRMEWKGVIESPLEGPAGNKEFLAWFQKA
jgi:23S rRNA (cytidine1920-2'-O)/16S rRNA (cytidine1409-2'-O)-methyltransferase